MLRPRIHTDTHTHILWGTNCIFCISKQSMAQIKCTGVHKHNRLAAICVTKYYNNPDIHTRTQTPKKSKALTHERNSDVSASPSGTICDSTLPPSGTFDTLLKCLTTSITRNNFRHIKLTYFFLGSYIYSSKMFV